MATPGKPVRQVIGLGVTQTVAWASSTYLPAILAEPIARDLGTSRSTVFGAFSVALIVMAFAGPRVGRAIDRQGGRGVLALSNIVLASGLVLLGCAGDVRILFAAWCVLGVGMAMGLYDAAFATLVKLHGPAARGPITGITLIAGFASTVGWPLTAYLSANFGWRASCFAWAAILLLLALPLNLRFIPRLPRREIESAKAESTAAGTQPTRADSKRLSSTFFLLVVFSAASAFVTSSMAAHLPGLLLAAGTSTVAAITAAALLGPAQVAARLAEFFAAREYRYHPIITARIATALHPVGALVLGLFGGAPLAASAFAVVHGAGNGMITIAKGTLPLALFGSSGYGARQGLLEVPSRATQALAPFAFGLVLEAGGAQVAIGVSAAASLVAFCALMLLQKRGD
jgi:MFS family permease